VLALAVQTGLRVSELTSLNCDDIALGAGASVRCEGKGRKQRTVPLDRPVQDLLRSWLNERAGHRGDPLFCTRTGRRLSRDAVAQRGRHELPVHQSAHVPANPCKVLPKPHGFGGFAETWHDVARVGRDWADGKLSCTGGVGPCRICA